VTAVASTAVGRQGHHWLVELARAAAIPLACAAAVTGLLSAWAATGGAGTLTQVRLQVTLAAVPMRSYTPVVAATVRSAGTFLTITNFTGTADELIAVRSPVASHAVLARRGTLGAVPSPVSALVIPAHGTLTLSPVTDDVILEDPAPFESQPTVPLTLVFRQAGQITINAPVTLPGTS
jgi:copper(I)-binding protein